jgi:hypothetical protein
MRKLFVPAIFITAVLATGCGTSASPSAPSALGSNASSALSSPTDSARLTTKAAADRGVPFKGTLDGTVTLTPLEPPLANVFIVATGNATHLGHFQVEIPHLVSFATATGEGTYTFTAANGDLLRAHFTGVADTSTPIFIIVEHAVITGGTGRFADATGSFTVRRSYDVAAGTTTGSIEGTIDF